MLGETLCELANQDDKVAVVSAAMKENLAKVLSLDLSRISIKAKTNEKLGELGLPLNDDNSLLITRTITADKNVCRVNNSLTSVSALREIGSTSVVSSSQLIIFIDLVFSLTYNHFFDETTGFYSRNSYLIKSFSSKTLLITLPNTSVCSPIV